MAFVIPEGLHEDLYPVAWMVGKWGGKGMGEWPGADKFEFVQEVTFRHDGRPFLEYTSKSWIIDSEGNHIRPGASEMGYWRIKPNKVIELLLAHSTGISEGWLGKISDDRPAIQLALDHAYVAPTAKGVTDGARLYGLVEGQLFTSYDMAAPGKELQAHIWSSLERQVEN
ncbi:Uncharacterised protein family UPF0678 [Candidatus Nanopelagicaceae bacterium]